VSGCWLVAVNNMSSNIHLASITDAELIEQNANQYKVIIQMARTLVTVHEQRLPHIHQESRGIMEIQFDDAAYIMDTLREIMLNIGAWDEAEDELTDPVFDVKNKWMGDGDSKANVQVHTPLPATATDETGVKP
jgi:hypothetical protein